MKKLLLIVFLSICHLPSYILHAQWTQRANLTGAARTNACGFSIGTKGYICCGYDANAGLTLDDLWEYDASANSWSQMASIPVRRQGAVAFTIGTKAYIGTGDDTTKLKDFWEWDQSSNTWTQRQDFFGTARTEAAGFSIGTKGYIGMGNDGSNKYDLYEYNPGTNTWTQKAFHPLTGRNGCIGFSIGGKGYIASGYASGNVFQQIYEYNPSSDAWTYMGMTNIPAYGMAACVVGNTTAFFGTGVDDNSTYYSAFTQWDPVNDTIALTLFGGTARYNAVSFSIGNSVFIGTGYDSWVTNDLWEYTTTVSVAENNFNNEISLFPNPAFNSMQVAVSSRQGMRLEIFDVHGKKVGNRQSSISNKTTIDISFLDKGVYYLKISSEGKTAVKKFVKM